MMRHVANTVLLSLAMAGLAAASVTAQELDAADLLAIIGPHPAELTIVLDAAGPLVVEGEALLRVAGRHTEVVIDVSGGPTEAGLSGSLVAGRCSDSGAVIAELGNVDLDPTGTGRLTAEVPVPLETLALDVISVELDGPPNGTVACGEHVPVAEAEHMQLPPPHWSADGHSRR